ncbi:MAG: helix-turn-helix transcriptional regulator [Alphaproteobacteria bacterium]|nr:helix-turn-helix transcriptional regulator [Alphaproteobacteria bacterium]
MSKLQIIHGADGQPAFAVIPWPDYQRLAGGAARSDAAPADASLAEAALSDEALYDLAIAANEETFPADVVDRLLAGERPLKVFREYRGMTQKALAAAVDINPIYLSQIETGKRTGSTKVLSALARALDLDLDDLV